MRHNKDTIVDEHALTIKGSFGQSINESHFSRILLPFMNGTNIWHIMMKQDMYV